MEKSVVLHLSRSVVSWGEKKRYIYGWFFFFRLWKGISIMWKEWHLTPSTSIVSVSLKAAAVVHGLHIWFLMQRLSPLCLLPLVPFALSVCMCVNDVNICQIWRGLRTAASGCLSGRDPSSSFASDRPATPESPVYISTPRAIRCKQASTHTRKVSVMSICAVVLIPLGSAGSVALLMERASSACGRSTRHHPTLNLTWWGHPLCPRSCKDAQI